MNDYGFEDMKAGRTESFAVSVTDAMLDSFRALSGDDNPLHSDAAYARGKGFKDRVVHGLLTSSFYSTLVGVHLPGRRALLQSIDVTFHAPVFAGDALQVSGEVAHVNEAYKVVELKARVKNQDGKTVSKAKIQVGFL